MTENSALQEAIDRINSAIIADKTFSLGDIQDIITHAETAEKRIAELERIDRNSIHQYRILTTQNTTLRNKIKDLKAMMPEVVSVEDISIEFRPYMLSCEDAVIASLVLNEKFPNGLRIIKGDE